MELGGTTPGTQYDQLHVGGTLSIGGILSVSLINGFMPAVGSSFDLLDWGTLSGTFSSLSLPTLATGQWDTSQLYTTGVLSVIPSPLAGDYNHNGVVDAADYVAWRHGLGTTYTQTDYDVWRANFGNTAASGSGSQTRWRPSLSARAGHGPVGAAGPVLFGRRGPQSQPNLAPARLRKLLNLRSSFSPLRFPASTVDDNLTAALLE